MENHHFQLGKSTTNGPFSILMLNYQRVKTTKAAWMTIVHQQALKWAWPLKKSTLAGQYLRCLDACGSAAWGLPEFLDLEMGIL